MRVLFVGSGDIGLPSLQWLLDQPAHEVIGVVTQPDKPVGRKQEILPSGIKQLALRRGVAVFQPARIKEPAALEPILATAPEMIVVMAYGQILPRALFEAGVCLNLHASLLPRHRGAAPIQAAIESGDRETGITVMHVAAGLDTGDMVLKRTLRIGRRETGGSLHDRLAALAPEALAEALELFAVGNAARIPQDDAVATYAPKLGRENGLIDWQAGWRAVDRRVRAMNPWPAAYANLPEPGGGSRKLKVFSLIVVRKQSGPPGTVLAADARGILIGTGDGAVLLREIQLEGKRRMQAREFLLGHPVAPGTVFCAP